MALINTQAAAELKALMRRSGHSPESLSEAIRQQAIKNHFGVNGTVDPHTIRRILKGHVPGARVGFVIAHYFGVAPDELWHDAQTVQLAA